MKRQAACVVGALCLALGTAAANPESSSGSVDKASLGSAISEQSTEQKANPELEKLQRRLADAGVSLGTPVMIRIFKAEGELELWVQKGERFELLTTYEICKWSGKLGPKLAEGDRQSPEGFYAVDTEQLHLAGRWPRSLDIGYPNTYDKANGRTGSFILVHGGCTSIGCFAMTNPVMAEIYALSEAALKQGQEQIQVHVFPFRMTEANMRQHAQSQWVDFWRNLKTAYDLFEKNRVPPQVSVCGSRYQVGDGSTDNHCVENISRASVVTAEVWNAQRIAKLRKARKANLARKAKLARKASKVKQARRGQRSVRQAGTVSRAGRMSLGGPKPRRR